MTAVFWPEHEALAVVLAEMADQPQHFPGISDTLNSPIRLILARSAAHVDSLLRGRAPTWSEAVAIPDARTIVLNASDRGRSITGLQRTLRHELAHLALRAHLGRAPPRWFDEGYATFAGGEWDWTSTVRVSLEVARARIPTLASVERDLTRGTRGAAGAAYQLSASAVALMSRWAGDEGLGPFMKVLAEDGNFSASMQQIYGLSMGQFEAFWRRDLRQRYGWLAVLAGVGIFWGPIGVLLIGIGVVRRRRNRIRRLRLDEGLETAQVLDASEVRG